MPAQALDRTRVTCLGQLLADLRRRLDHDGSPSQFLGELALRRPVRREQAHRAEAVGGCARRPRSPWAAHLGGAELALIEQPLGRFTPLPGRGGGGTGAAQRGARWTSAPTGWWLRDWAGRTPLVHLSGCGWPTPSRWPSTAPPERLAARCSTSTSPHRSTPCTPTNAGCVRGQRRDPGRGAGRGAARSVGHRVGGGGAGDRPAGRRGDGPSVAADAGAGRPVNGRPVLREDGYRVGGA
jgi:hypothetical protein